MRVNKKFDIFEFSLVMPDCARVAQLFQMIKFPQIDRFRSTDKNRNHSLGIFGNKKFHACVTCERRQIIEFRK